MLQAFRERLTLILLVLLPFHAFVVTVGTRMLSGFDNPPMAALAVWKEAFLAIILLLACIEVLRRRSFRPIDAIDALVVAMIALATILFVAGYPSSAVAAAYGAKYDFIPLIAFLIVRRVPWSARFWDLTLRSVLIVGVIIAVYGLATLFLPASFFTRLGYSDLHSLYLPDAPIAAFQHIGGTAIRRIQSVMSGPNQLGLWLLLPLSIALTKLRRWKMQDTNESAHHQRNIIVLVSCIFVLSSSVFFTFSRTAWIGAAIIAIVGLGDRVRARTLMVGAGAVVIAGLALMLLKPDLLLRAASSKDHLTRPIEAMHVIEENPIGLGLGTAGPASNRISDACTYLSEGDDVTWWRENRPEHCVFVADSQIQPADRTCDCPRIPENWYLQIGIELGVLGFVLYLTLMFITLRRLWNVRAAYPVPFAFMLAIAIGGLLLHSFEDAAVAVNAWMLAAIVLQTGRNSR